MTPQNSFADPPANRASLQLNLNPIFDNQGTGPAKSQVTRSLPAGMKIYDPAGPLKHHGGPHPVFGFLRKPRAQTLTGILMDVHDPASLLKESGGTIFF